MPKLQVGDLAITTHEFAGSGKGLPRVLGDNKLVEVLGYRNNTDCFWVRKYPSGTDEYAVAADWLSFYWRPNAPDPQ
jgi:hypothetical protein